MTAKHLHPKRDGLVEQVGMRSNGRPVWQLTPAGEAREAEVVAWLKSHGYVEGDYRARDGAPLHGWAHGGEA